jgi:metal-responsive CopG/Arc/MetJ family transcriptional regulator
MPKKLKNKDKRVFTATHLPPELLKQLDAQADREGRTRSNMIAQMIRQGLA